MWLVSKKKILTKDNLIKKGWVGDVGCQFCGWPESLDHLFLKCPLIQPVWFWMGNCQDVFTEWNSVSDIIAFACTLTKYKKQAFLIMMSALCWSVWNHINELCFLKTTSIKSNRNIVLLIRSTIFYWLGAVTDQVKEEMAECMVEDTYCIPLDVFKEVPMVLLDEE